MIKNSSAINFKKLKTKQKLLYKQIKLHLNYYFIHLYLKNF